MRRRALVTTLMLAIALLSTRPAHAQPAQACTISLVDTRLSRGSIVVMRGVNFPTTPRSLPIMIDGSSQRVGLATIDADGQFAEPIRIPGGIDVGAHHLSVACAETEVVTAIEVVSADAAVADTNDDDETRELLIVGAAAVVVALVLTAGRRRAHRVST